jgi:hypothetical protein
MIWTFLPDAILQEILLFIDLKEFRTRFSRLNEKKKELLVWKPEYIHMVYHYSPLYYSFQWVDLNNNPYEQELAMRTIHEKKISKIHSLLTKLNEMYSRKYYKNQSTFTNLYGKTFTKEMFDQRYQKLIMSHCTYLHYFPTAFIDDCRILSCVNWRGEDPSSWLND